MTKKEIRRAARDMILAGSTRQQAFVAMQQQSTEPAEKVADLVRYIPTLEARRKYHTPWVALIVLMLLGVLVKVFLGYLVMLENGNAWWPALLLMPLVNVLLTVGVIQYRGETFRFITFLTVIGVLRGIGQHAAGGFGLDFLLDMLFAGVLIALSYYLNTRMVSAPKEVKERYTNAQGQDRLRNTLVFEER